MRKVTESEFWTIVNEICTSFQPADDRNCPTLGERIGKGEIEKVPKVNLSELPVGSAIYFCGQQTAAGYTLKIAEDNKVKLWRNLESNALIGPIDRIISRDVRISDSTLLEEGVLSVGNIFYMPYFKYETNASGTQEILQPNETYFGTCLAIILERA